jgi:hypothetical protein
MLNLLGVSLTIKEDWLSGAQVPGKIKVHMWRLIENGLAVGTKLSYRRIKDGVVCLACGRTEDLVHRLVLIQSLLGHI